MHHGSTAFHARKARMVATGALACLLALAAAGCSGSATNDKKTAEAAPAEIVLASTTSTQDSGLFDVLIPAFEDADPRYKVQVVAVGTGEALKLGETKDADVLLVHAKADEEKFVANGFGRERRDVMYNDFVLVGPASDPAGVKSSADTNAAMRAIATAGNSGKAVFVSRGDDSGTYKKEVKLWAPAGVQPTPTPEADSWYLETGQGMGETLTIASNKQGYTLADRATYLSMKDALDLEIVYEKDKALLNQYGVIVVTGAKNEAGGRAFFEWVLSAAGQTVIGEYGAAQFGQPLFVPNAK